MEPVPSSDEQRILAAFFRNGRLVRLPAKWKKRMVILQHLVRAFSPERSYREADVNTILSRYHPDVATIRREFVVFGLMTRERGVYRRTGEED